MVSHKNYLLNGIVCVVVELIVTVLQNNVVFPTGVKGVKKFTNFTVGPCDVGFLTFCLISKT